MLHAQFMPIFFEGADNDFMQSDLTEVIVKFSGDIQFIRQDLDAQVEILLKGYEYSNEQIDQAIQSLDPYSVVPSIDTGGHGTAVAGIAAGNGSENPDNIGVAPESDLIVVNNARPYRVL